MQSNVQQNNQLNRRSGKTREQSTYTREDAQVSSEIEQEDNFSNDAPQKIQQKKERIYFDDQVKENQKQTTYAQAKPTRSGRIQQSTTYGARMRAPLKAAQLNDDDNWASASEENTSSSSSASKEVKATESIRILTVVSTPASANITSNSNIPTTTTNSTIAKKN